MTRLASGGPIKKFHVPVKIMTETPYGVALGLFYLFFAGMMYALNRAVQRLVNQAHESRLQAEAAAQQAEELDVVFLAVMLAAME